MSKSTTLVTNEKLEICPYCEGKGYYFISKYHGIIFQTHPEQDQNYTESINKYAKTICTNCSGKGRMKKITTIEYKKLDE